MQPPLGLRLSQAARTVTRAFDEALAQAGGTLPVWLILLNLTIHRHPHQRALAEAVGVTDATLTHHLNALEKRGLITRRPAPGNRRVHVVEITEEGGRMFLRLREAATAFDTRLRTGFDAEDSAVFSDLLDRLVANVGGAEAAVPWKGLAEGTR